MPSLSPTALATLDLEHVEGVVLLLSDAENYAVCEYIYEHHGIENVVVRLEKGSNFDKFNALGA
ncbi:MAG: hypothetical protein KAG66_09060, partial [Methylococcales bacterium]|nr:hypothetical protein [Methylococcales bacterium]